MRKLPFIFYICSLLALGASTGRAQQMDCSKNPDALGTSRTVSLSRERATMFGIANYPAPKFLQDHEIVLTFDDGPSPESTSKILEALKENCTRATFFVLGMRAEQQPELVKQLANDGHTIGTHTYSHPDLSAIKFARATAEVQKGLDTVKAIAGNQVTRLFRYPYLRDTKQLNRYLSDNDMTIVSTDIDSFDYNEIPSRDIVKNVVEQLKKKGRGVIMMHDIMLETAKAMPDLLTELRRAGYRVVQMEP